MARVELTGEQRAAIYAAGGVLVRAGAGSGKTEVLARRFVALVAGDIEGRAPLVPQQIAAITFTEKATADMRGRIAEVLDERIAQEPAEERRRMLARARRALGLARISTIHAFCAHLLREHPLEAGVDPGFDVLDEYQSATFLQRVCRELLADAVRRRDRGAIRLAGARGLHGTKHRAGAIDLLLRLTGDAARMGKQPSWIIERAAATAQELRSRAPRLVELRAELVAQVEKLLRIKGIDGTARKKLDQARGEWPRLRAEIAALSADSDPPQLDVLVELHGSIPDARNTTLRDGVREIRRIIQEIDEAYGACRAATAIKEIAGFVAEAGDRLVARKRGERVVTFDDLLTLARRLLERHPEVATHYRRTIAALLVDEYQDTDPVQDAVVRLLTEGGAPAPELFIVGDEKQSIYRFRGADVTVFNRPRALVAPAELPLRENRRSLPEIVEFVNAVGASVMAPRADGKPPYRVEWRDAHRLIAVRPALGAAAVELIVKPGGGNGAGSREGRRVEADAIARRCAQMVAEKVEVFDRSTEKWRPVRFSDIAVLMRSFTDVAVYEAGFARARVPYYTVKGRGFFECKEVRDLAALLGAIDDPRSSVELAAALRSPLFGISDQCLLEMALHLEEQRAADGPRRPFWKLFDEPHEDFAWLGDRRDVEAARRARNVLAELRAMRERERLSVIVERALELTRFEAVMLRLENGRRRAANARKLAELARDFESHRFFGFADFARHLRRLVDEQPLEPQAPTAAESEDVVRLMTIHQAKGLEFPVVILADLGRRPRSNSENVVMSPEYGLLACDTVGAGDEALPNPLLAQWREVSKDQEQAEAARILYVAITRARDRLILSEGPRGADWQTQIRAVVGEAAIADFEGGQEAERVVETPAGKVTLRRADVLAKAPVAGVEQAAPRVPIEELAASARARLGFAAPAARELVTSPSALEDFERCPRQYFLRHELALPEGDLAGATGDGGNASALGTIAHAVLEQFPARVTSREREAEIARLVDLHSAGSGVGAGERRALVRDLSRYVASAEFVQRAGAPGARREAPFFLRLEDGGFTLFVRGRIDLLADDGARIVVGDYKYARAGEHDYRVQMKCYALAAREAYPERKVEAEIIYLRERAERRVLELEPAAAMREHLLALGRRMAAAAAAGVPAAYPMGPAAPAACHALGCGYVARCWRLERARHAARA
jgi:ATP-dependent helicase/nuclease subunit A